MAGSGTIGIRLAIEGARAVIRGLESVRNEGDRVSRSFEGIGKLVPFGGIMKGAGVAAAALGGLAAAGAVAGVKTAASMEQASISFTTMLGSAQEADGFIRQLQQFAATTPFDFPGLQTAASSLISAGISADKVIPIMTSLGNATSGMGTGAEGVQRATIALQQMSAAGKITGEDLNQLRDAGIPVFDLLAAATGKSKEEVAGLAQAGKLGKTELDQLMGALESGKGLERFSGLMDKQSQSLSGLASTFKDTIGMGLATTMTPLLPALKAMLDFASQLAAKVLPQVQSALAGVAPQMERLAGGLSMLLNTKDFSAGGIGAAFELSPEQTGNLTNFMATFKAGAQGVLAALTPVWNGIKNAPVSTLSVLQGVLGWMAEHTLAVQMMASALSMVVVAITGVRLAVMAWTAVQTVLNFVISANPIGLIVLAIAALVGALIVAYQNSETFRNAVQGVWDWVKKAAVVVWDLFLKFTPLGQAISLVKGNFDTIKGAIGGFVDKIKDAWTWVQKLVDRINNSSIGSLLGGVGSAVSSVGDALGFRAEGGPVAAGSPYIVGEQGPELMVPGVSGRVINNRDLNASLAGSMSGGGDVVVHQTTTLDGRVLFENWQRHAGARMARA